ncbi:hypothetical protein C8Q74DRAFT_1435862 [Fomes fomentarius]|nr:hypothetical protein C8Q74DRAFT_1435862 [Fomes fomentarius]
MNTPHISPTDFSQLSSNVHLAILRRRVPHLFNIRLHSRRSKRATMPNTRSSGTHVEHEQTVQTYPDAIRQAILNDETVEDLLQLTDSLRLDLWGGLLHGIRLAFVELMNLSELYEHDRDMCTKLPDGATSWLGAIHPELVNTVSRTHPGFRTFVSNLKIVSRLALATIFDHLSDAASRERHRAEFETLMESIFYISTDVSNASFSTDAPVTAPSSPNPPAEEWNLDELSATETGNGSREVGEDSRLMQVLVPAEASPGRNNLLVGMNRIGEGERATPPSSEAQDPVPSEAGQPAHVPPLSPSGAFADVRPASHALKPTYDPDSSRVTDSSWMSFTTVLTHPPVVHMPLSPAASDSDSHLQKPPAPERESGQPPIPQSPHTPAQMPTSDRQPTTAVSESEIDEHDPRSIEKLSRGSDARRLSWNGSGRPAMAGGRMPLGLPRGKGSGVRTSTPPRKVSSDRSDRSDRSVGSFGEAPSEFMADVWKVNDELKAKLQKERQERGFTQTMLTKEQDERARECQALKDQLEELKHERDELKHEREEFKREREKWLEDSKREREGWAAERASMEENWRVERERWMSVFVTFRGQA